MNIRMAVGGVWLAMLAALLHGCGGGTKLAEGQIGGSGITSSGSITAFGSVIVNGVKFDSTSASVTINGASQPNDGGLRVGMVVKVKGWLSSDRTTGRATSIDYESEFRGTVDAAPTITPTGGSFAVFGQVVLVDPTTVFDNAVDLTTSIAAGTIVEVSGFRDSSGQVHATRIEVKSTLPSTIEVRGTIGNVTATTFTLGNITVNYASATQKGFPTLGLVNGLFVEVKAAALPVGGTLIASSVEVQSAGIGAAEKEQAEVEGLVNNFSGGTSFTVNGQAVSVNSSTTYSNGTAASLANNIRVQVEGTIGNGILVAARVQFGSASNISLKAQVGNINLTGQTLTVFGSPGVVVKVTSTTSFRDSSSAQMRIFGLGNIVQGDRLSIKGSKDGSNSITATLIERTNPDTKVSLSGSVDSAVIPIIVVLGVNAVTSTTTQFLDANEKPTSQNLFFNQLSGKVVQLEGTFNGSTINVTAASLED